MSKFEVGDIIFYESNTFIGRVIRKVTKFPFSHAALAISPNDIIEANAFIKSRRVSFAETDYKRVVVMRSKTTLSDAQKIAIIQESRQLLGRGYDYWAIFVFALKYIFGINTDNYATDATKLWCTELVDYVYHAANIDLVPEAKNHFVSIEDVAKSENLYQVREMYRNTIFDKTSPW